MRLTHEQARALGLLHLWPKDKPATKFVRDGMNKLERAFWERLLDAVKHDEFTAAWREPITLRLAGHTTYKPDFMTHALLNNVITCWEVKGFMRDDAAVKLKVAAAAFACFKWVLVRREKSRWRCVEVTDKGFSREEFTPDWLA
jgi:hypothetical protein